MFSDFFNAIPNSGGPDRLLLRDAQVRRTIYPFASNEDPSTWYANVGGTVPLAIANEYGGLFFLDPLDGSTPPDGVTVIRTADNYCYKISNMVIPDSVLEKDKVEPDGDEEIGDAYIVASAPDGLFAYNPDQIAVLTIRGWLFIETREGRSIYVRGDRHYFRDENGLWLPSFAPLQGGVRDADVVGGVLYRAVENSTTNTPPVSPTPGVYWRIGGSPTGAWAGQADKIATYYEGDVAWTIINPIEGYTIFDKVAKITYVHDGANWVSQRGSIIASQQIATASGSVTGGGSGLWSYNPPTSAPTNTMQYLQDDATITHTARRTNAPMIFKYRAFGQSLGFVSPALFRDNEAAAIDWLGMVTSVLSLEITFYAPALDTASHVYKVRWIRISGSAMETALYRRLFTLDEYA